MKELVCKPTGIGSGMDDDEYRDKLNQAYQDGWQAGRSCRSQDAIPYYEDLNCDQVWDGGYRVGREECRQNVQKESFDDLYRKMMNSERKAEPTITTDSEEKPNVAG